LHDEPRETFYNPPALGGQQALGIVDQPETSIPDILIQVQDAALGRLIAVPAG
jgi:hypothetical protein